MPNPKINLQRLYVKNLSYETLDTPKSFRLQGNMQHAHKMEVSNKKLEDKDDHYEVVLTLIVETKVANKLLCVTKVEQAGIFQIENVTEKQLDMILKIHCPQTLYPYACCAISQLTTLGSLPPVILQHMDFSAIYQHLQNQQSQKAEQEQHATPGFTMH